MSTFTRRKPTSGCEQEIHSEIKLKLMNSNCVDYWSKKKAQQHVPNDITHTIFKYYSMYIH